MIEKKIIEIIKSLDRITDTFDKLVLRRTLLIVFTILLLTQTIMTTLIWLIYKDISTNWLGMMTIEYAVFGTMVGFYFAERKRNGSEE